MAKKDEKEIVLEKINKILKERDIDFLQEFLEGLEIDEAQGVF